MKFKVKATIVVILLIVSGAAAFLLLKPSTGWLTARGRLQDGRKYAVTCEVLTASSLPLGGQRRDTLRSLDFTLEGKSRRVPENALRDITEIDSSFPPQVSEEGPVVVITLHAGQNHHPVQWRYLNGFFAQRRILNGTETSIHNAQATLQAPTMVGVISPDAPRRLGSPSLLSTPDDTPQAPLKNGHE